MKSFLKRNVDFVLAAALFVGLLLGLAIGGSAQSYISRRCPGVDPSPANATVTVNKDGSIAVTACTGKTITFGGATMPASGTVVTTTGTQTLTNKTLTSPVLTNGGTLTLPTSTDTLVGRATTDALTHKTLNDGTNLISANTLFTARNIDGVSFDGSADILTNTDLNLMRGLGSAIAAQTCSAFNIGLSTGSGVINNQVVFTAIYLPKAQTLNGVKWFQFTQGSYTANNSNQVGLYSYAGGTLTLVASSANDGTTWSATVGGALGSKAFSSTYAAAAGVYFIGVLYNQSAQTTAPTVYTCPGHGGLIPDFTNNAKYVTRLSAQTALPSSTTMAGMSAGTTAAYWLALY